MTFSERKKTLLVPQKEKKLFTFLVALITAACLFVPYMIMSEGYFTFYGDFNVQQIPFYQMCHGAIRDGNINWNWLTDLGSDFVGAYAFYTLGSPFFWVTLIFPNSFVPYLMGPLLILKFAFAALTGYMYIRRFTKTSYAASLGGLLYAFSGFSIYNIFFNHFHEAIIVFPLLLLSIELLITENRRGVFALAVAFCAITNYFFFFGMVVFCVIYFFVRLYSKAIKVKITRFWTFVFEAILGVALASVLLVPALNAVMGNERISSILMGWNGITYGKEQIYLYVIQSFFFPPDIPARPVFFPEANVKWSSVAGWLPVFSMTGFFTWFKLREKSWQKRLLAICALCALVPILNSAFYAFNTSYYARWFYMPVLIIALATVMLAEDKKVDFSYGLKWTTAITLAFVLVIGFFPQTVTENGKEKLIFGLYTQDSNGTYALRFWTTSLIALICLVVQKLLFIARQKSHTKFYMGAIACVCAVSIVYGNVFIATGRMHSYEVKDVVIDSLIEGEVNLPDDSEYRIDVYDGVDNTGMYLGLPSINAFHSVVSPSIMEFYDYIGVERSVASRPDTDVPAIRSLLSVKYLLNRTDGDSFIDEDGETLMPGFEYLKTSGNYYVYENQNYVPYGFSYDYYMSYKFCDDYSESLRSQLMLKAILLTDDQIEKYGDYMTNVEELRYQSSYDDSIVSLNFNDNSISVDAAALRQTAAEEFKVDNKGFSARVTRDKKSLVFFSVPYDKGWTATVNGKAVNVEKVNAGFMAIAVDEGVSWIRFDYQNPGLALGVSVTLGAAIIFIIYMIVSSYYKKRVSTDTEYPEGDKLLNAWKDETAPEYEVQESEGSSLPIQSIFDLLEEEKFPTENNEIQGGFKIDSSVFDEGKKDET
ncbi:MAG: YfhO family protein [Clostridia bacterium]|nr:YfhO family protein [Clostridia bacterium]